MAADDQRSAAENLFYGAECLLHPLVLPYQSVQNKQYSNSFRGNPLGSVPNTTVISYNNESIVAQGNWISQAISLRSCERPLLLFPLHLRKNKQMPEKRHFIGRS